jgi:hypothetical protein
VFLNVRQVYRGAAVTKTPETLAHVARARVLGNMVVSEMEWRNPWPNRAASKSKFRSRRMKRN